MEQRLRLARKAGNDGTVRDVLVQREKIRGERSDELDADVPQCCNELWRAFLCMHSQRDPGFSGVTPLSISEVRAYASLYQVRFTSWELDTLWAIDRVAREVLETKPDKEH